MKILILCLLAAFSIENPDMSKIFRGDPKEFDKPAEVNYMVLIKSTPEYKEMLKEEPSTGKYWIKLSQACDKVIAAILNADEK